MIRSEASLFSSLLDRANDGVSGMADRGTLTRASVLAVKVMRWCYDSSLNKRLVSGIILSR